jgi:hypothetical protein
MKEDIETPLKPIEEIWDFKSDSVYFGIKTRIEKAPVEKIDQIKKGSEVFLSYGERSNDYLLV